MKHAIAASVLLALLAGDAAARPAYRRALVDLLELPTSSKLNDCRVCHLPPNKGDDENAVRGGDTHAHDGAGERGHRQRRSGGEQHPHDARKRRRQRGDDHKRIGP